MVNMFVLILVIVILVMGILWCVDKFFFVFKWWECQVVVQVVVGDLLDKVMLKKVVLKFGWLEIGVFVFLVLVIVLIVCLFIYELFQILLGLMMLILLIGDFILVEKFVYGIKDFIYQKMLIEIGYLKCGDIVVFKYLEDLKFDYIKCVVGLLGDKVIYDLVLKELMI